MPCHLIRDAGAWIKDIHTVPIDHLAKRQQRVRDWGNQSVKKTLSSLTIVSFCELT